MRNTDTKLYVFNSSKFSEMDWMTLIPQIVYFCFTLTEVVNPIVASSSPEGYLPDDIDLNTCEVDETAKAQMMLVFAWRTVKEVSLLLGEIALAMPLTEQNKELLLEMGKCFIHLLLTTKHRGAFEQAYLGFANLCSRMWR